ncbi:PhoX family protein [Leucothrix arctica]|uniref:dTDP-glucose 4,6-dehydratase n=1 Tax=Leucothrix arctica TaxID=1481894 RepID=A0A317CH55_9GAMM|nr:PhoX family phosphatase [Leucothrix arctica]PWQ97886.1 dTDP-glucose 4,6-dehydratase [Leucothrix arctica]
MSKATFDPTRFNKSNNETFAEVLEKEVSRRSMLKFGGGMAALSMMAGFGLAGCDSDSKDTATVADIDKVADVSLGFQSIAGSKLDAVAIPAGYVARILAPWGTPLNSDADAWKNDGTNSATDQDNAVGMHHDGMRFFSLNDSSTEGLLCINHEYIDQNALHPTGASFDDAGLRSSVEEVRKEINAHGVTVVHVELVAGVWQVVDNAAQNRRFTAATEMDIAGPLKGHESLVTAYAPNGDVARGTLNNCGNGDTPWGTYLTCEENWPGYFTNSDTLTTADARIGISTRGTRYSWEDVAGDESEVDSEFARYDTTATGDTAADDYRNEANGHGYIVEIDPYDELTKAVKRTALGRFRHEGCAYGKLTAGKPIIFYSGHDSRFEYIYKFVSTAMWDAADANATDRLAVGAKYMDEGTLYVAKFSEGGVGEWLPLTLTGATTDGGTLADTFATQAEIILNTAGAADLVGATPMDRPEWTAVDPITGVVYLTLTNNTRRTEEEGTNPANPRLNNSFGHIIRWEESDDQTSFEWDIFVFGSDDEGDAETNLSGLDELNQFASPDGLAFDSRGILWVQTDNGADEVEEYTNDQMLAVIPSQLRDDNGDMEVINADNQTELRRFFVGPNGCEVTGLSFTPDHKHCFLNIQHPENWPYSLDATEETPAGVSVRPRASTVVISRVDGGDIGV